MDFPLPSTLSTISAQSTEFKKYRMKDPCAIYFGKSCLEPRIKEFDYLFVGRIPTIVVVGVFHHVALATLSVK